MSTDPQISQLIKTVEKQNRELKKIVEELRKKLQNEKRNTSLPVVQSDNPIVTPSTLLLPSDYILVHTRATKST